MLKSIVTRAKEIYIKEMFTPGLLGLFINPYYFSRKGLYNEIKSNKHYLKGKLLDFGCGAKPYQNLIDVENYIGLDIENNSHNHENEKIDVYYDGLTIPFPDNTFDSYFSSQVLEHISNLEEILQEIIRVLKPKAYLLITVPFVWEEHEIPFDFKRYTSYGIEHTLTNVGFKIVKLKKSTKYVTSIFQLWNNFIYQHVFPKNKFIKLLLTPVFIFPITLLGIFISKLLPRNDSLYLDNIIIAKKPD
jgi:ubiquinone/menaquinone biosynthesis C-methylase UbiE